MGKFQNRTTLDFQIISNVIEDIVIVDCNIDSGRIKYIPLLSQYAEMPEPEAGFATTIVGQFGIYRIPSEARENVNISKVIGIHYPIRGFTGTNPHGTFKCPWSTVNALGDELIRSHTMSNTPPMPIPELLQGNLIRLIPDQFAHMDWILSVKLMYDNDMTNLTSSALRRFARMCLYATQMYIYTNLIIKVDKAYIEGGQELGSFKELIDEYKDAEEKYEEERLRFKGINFLDTKTKMTILEAMM
jgi:hypothetical protein